MSAAAASDGRRTLSVAARRELGRRLSALANATVTDVIALASAQDATSTADHAMLRIGITGPPGAGKSSLAGALGVLRAQRACVGILAIDPSSPRTGGAILGDRIRIDELEGASDLYVRSLASRNASDGLSDNLPELVAAMSDAGFDEILLETVGVGQAEHAIRSEVDTLVLVLPPEAGDLVQAMKAGIMEVADVYVVHKADLAGADRMAADVLRVLHLTRAGRGDWKPRVLRTTTRDAASIAALSDEIDRHRAFVAQSPDAAATRVARARYRLRSLLQRQVGETLARLPDAYFDAGLAAQHRGVLERMRTA